MYPTKESYWYFSKSKRIAVATILIVVLAISLYPYLRKKEAVSTQDAAKYDKAIAALQLLQEDSSATDYSSYQNSNYSPKYKRYERKSYNNSYSKDVPGTLFSFDPNTLSVEGWQKLGVREKTALTIQKYISKGGRFRKPEDLRKVYGLSTEMVQALIPYAKIPKQPYENTYSNTYRDNKYESQKTTYTDRPKYYKPEPKPFNINDADSSLLDALPGIGPSYARRIINYRNKLGGFYSVQQVAEVYGLPDSVFQKIKPYLLIDESRLHTININTAGKEDLQNHPYIRWQLAQNIISYREQHGKYTRKEDLRKIMSISAEQYKLMAPYIAVD